jgi:hypothetical protein
MQGESRGGDLPPGTRSPIIPLGSISSLPDTYFSIGTGNVYYETINTLTRTEKLQYLKAVRDCAYDLDIFRKFEQEQVMQQSLLRSIS